MTRRDYAGWTLWAIGFLFEVIADHQKSRFRANPNNTVRITELRITAGSSLEYVQRCKDFEGKLLNVTKHWNDCCH